MVFWAKVLNGSLYGASGYIEYYHEEPKGTVLVFIQAHILTSLNLLGTVDALNPA